MCSKSCTCSAHSWEKSRVSLRDILFSDQGGAHEMWTVLCRDWTIITRLRAYKHVRSTPDYVTSSSCDLHPQLKMQAAQIFVGMPQKHMGMNHSCEETTVGINCTWTVTKVWNSNFFFIWVNLQLDEEEVKGSLLMCFCSLMTCFTRHRSAENLAQINALCWATIAFVHPQKREKERNKTALIE